MKKLLLAILVLSSTIYAATFEIDPVHSKVSFKVKHLMITNVHGTFSKYDATIDYDEKTKTITTLMGNIDVKSISTENEKRDKDLRSPNFFDVENYPMITFKLLSVDGDEALGELTIKGITKKVTFDFENNGTVVDPWGNTRLGLSLETKISRKDFGILYNNLIEAGGVVVSDKIRITVDIEAIKKK
ncbi:MAG: YceI family protein [Campylobacteraceae bacterium]|nr:YceI family protein [Campylobacteraceae bacterium]